MRIIIYVPQPFRESAEATTIRTYENNKESRNTMMWMILITNVVDGKMLE